MHELSILVAKMHGFDVVFVFFHHGSPFDFRISLQAPQPPIERAAHNYLPACSYNTWILSSSTSFSVIANSLHEG